MTCDVRKEPMIPRLPSSNDGPGASFSKKGHADATAADAQERRSLRGRRVDTNVWLTRGEGGERGQSLLG